MWNSRYMDYGEIPNDLIKGVKGGYSAKGTERSELLTILMDTVVAKLNDYVCPSFHNPVHATADDETWVCSMQPS